MMLTKFTNIRTWIFDLDNTLYPPEARLFDQIEVRMTDWVARELKVDRGEADRLRKHYWDAYGTTLAGLMAEHGVDPGPYLHEVHEISMAHLEPDPILAAQIAALPGRRIVYTNGSEPYARRVLAARGLEKAFDGVFGIEHAEFIPKPERAAFEKILEANDIDPSTAVMFEDDPRNLAAPFALGMRTVLVSGLPNELPFVHHYTADLSEFLSQIA